MNSELAQDPEIQRLMAQQELLKNMKRIQNTCWDVCMQDGVDYKLTSRQESCLTYCADRFVDSVIILTNKFNQRMTGGGHH